MSDISDRIARLKARHDAMMARRERGIDLCLAGEPDEIAFADCDEAEIRQIRNTVMLVRAFQQMYDTHERDMAAIDDRDPVMAESMRQLFGNRITSMRVVGLDKPVDIEDDTPSPN